MVDQKWLSESVRQAETDAQKLRERIAAKCEAQDELDRLAAMDEMERQPILKAAEELLADNVRQVNQMADDLADFAGAPVGKPRKMTPELFIHPPHIAPRLLYQVPEDNTFLEYAYYFYWPIHFYETKLRLCLTISADEEPLFVTAKDLSADSLFRFTANNLDAVKKRLLRNVERHAYLNKLYEAGVF